MEEEIKDILIDNLYFVISFDDLLKSVDWNQNFEAVLLGLLHDGWVSQLRYDKASGDFVKQAAIDETLAGYSYLATKKGLLAHNGF